MSHVPLSEPTLRHTTRMLGRTAQRYFFAGLWLIYLTQTATGVHKHSHGGGIVIGYLIIAAFALIYLAALPVGWERPTGRFWILFALGCVLTGIETQFAGPDALVFCVYLAVLAVASQARGRLVMVVVLAAVVGFAPMLVANWGGHIDWAGVITVGLVALAMFGFFEIIRANIALTAARTEVARLAAENERTRIARDLHDLLGHSLTTITVKSGLARRLAERDPQRAHEEIAAVEELARRTLEEVRAAVTGYREVSLSGELASAREVLRAAGIEATLPGAVDIVDTDAIKPFGWVLREAITNVVRHSRAAHCTVTVGPRWIEIWDDGGGAGAGCEGNGLRGVRERLAALGGTIEVTTGPAGWVVRAELGSRADAQVEQAARVHA